ncbi:MAG: hypothetical protein V4739_16840 [Pseudomonadota bacterium]
MAQDDAFHARAQQVRLERRQQALRRNRRTALHATVVVLALTWGVGWPLCQWRTARHEAIGRIEPAGVPLEALGKQSPPAEYLLLDGARPRLRQAVQMGVAPTPGGMASWFADSSPAASQTAHHYLPLTPPGRDTDAVRVVAVGLAPQWLDPRAAAPLKPPYSLQWVKQGLPPAVHKEMTRRGVRFADTVYLLKFTELVNGRVPNTQVNTDRWLLALVAWGGSALAALAALQWGWSSWQLRRLRLDRQTA